MKKNIIAVTFMMFGVFANAQTTKEIKIAELLETMGSTQAMKTSYEYMIEHYKKSNPTISAEYWEKATSLVNYEDLVQKLVPVYSKHFSEQEIEDLIAFYQTATGKQMITKMPAILQESMQIGQTWGIELAEKIEKKLPQTKRQYDNPPPPMRNK